MPDMLPIASLLRPASVAVIGASNDRVKFGGKVAANIHRSRIPARYFVNARGESVLGERSYRALEDLPEVPEAVVLAVPADVSLGELRRAAALGVRAAVLFAAGFREGGPEGLAREAALRDLAARHGMAILGPNCVGAANFADGVFLSSSDGLEAGPPGPTALVAQSGSVGIALTSRQAGRFSHFISTGNEAVVHASDLLGHLAAQDGVETIALMLEHIPDRDRLAAAAATARAAGKRVVLLKLAAAGASAEMAAMHTGALSGARAPLEAFCEQHGILLARSLRDFNAILTLLSATRYRGGKRLGIFTTSGGSAVLGAGLAEGLGLALPSPADETRATIAAVLGMDAARVTNPLDTTGIHAFDSARFGQALAAFAEPGAYDLVLVPLGGAQGQDAARRVDVVRDVAAASAVPIVPVWQQQRMLEEPAFQRLYESSLPLFTEVEAPVEAMAALAGAAPPAPAAGAHPMQAGATPTLAALLGELDGAGVAVPPFRVLRDAADAPAALAMLGTPVALKASHPRLLHKSDAGLVRFPLRDAPALAAAAADMARQADTLGLAGAELVMQAAAPEGVELLCGFGIDVEMGPHLVVAAGGIYTELLRDAAVVLLEPREGLEARIETALRRLRIWPILAGARGRAGRDWPAAVVQMRRIADWFLAAGHQAAEVNPLIVGAEGALAVDIRASGRTG